MPSEFEQAWTRINGAHANEMDEARAKARARLWWDAALAAAERKMPKTVEPGSWDREGHDAYDEEHAHNNCVTEIEAALASLKAQGGSPHA
jgi:hypothetical protein